MSMIEYYPAFFKEDLFGRLERETDWKAEKIRLFGKEVLQPRLVAWHGDPQAIYTYSGLTMKPMPWTGTLLYIKEEIEDFTGRDFNSVLLNYYRTGDDYMGWHSDNEPELSERPYIASASFGGTRRFQLKHRVTKEVLEYELEDGSLLIMKDQLQEEWIHRIAPTKRSVAPRINLTFRKIYRASL